MPKKPLISRLTPILALTIVIIFFIGAFIRGNFLVQKSEKELNPKKQIEEAQAKEYSLKEIDAKTGQIHWQLTAKEGRTEENLQAALINDVRAEVYKDNEIIFELIAPHAKANASTKEIYLFGEFNNWNRK
jgi:LPS export ABC transporter protein LptC